MKAIEMKTVTYSMNKINYRYQGKMRSCGHESEKL